MLTVIYDGKCVVCNSTKRLFMALDRRENLQWVDLHDSRLMSTAAPQLSRDAAMGQIHVLDGGRVFAGFYGIRRMMKAAPLLYPFWLAMWLPGMTWIGQRAYRFAARRRYWANRVSGQPVCENGCLIS